MRYDHVDVTIFEQADRIGHNKSASGIIAALTIFNSEDQYWHAAESAEEIEYKVHETSRFFRLAQWNLRVAAFSNKVIWNQLSGDARTQKDYRRSFNQASRLRLEEQLDRHPAMCEAIIGPYCCRAGSSARKWMDKAGGENHSETCEVKRGLFHAFTSEEGWSNANRPESAKEGGWDWGMKGNDTDGLLEDAKKWLKQDEIEGVLWNDIDEGFVRVETLYPILTKIFEESGRVRLAVNCAVSSLKTSDSGIEVVAPDCAAAGSYDRVVVAGGANSVNVIADQDELILADLLPIKGFAVATHEPIMEKSQLGTGMHVEDLSHYIRPTITGGIAYGFGKEIGSWDDQLLDPQYEDWGDDGPAATGLGREVLEQKDVQKLSGIRPFSSWLNSPLLKRYDGKWSGLVLNTGYGFYGYTLSWKSAQLAAEVAVLGEVSDKDFAASVELYEGCGRLPCWVYRWYLIFGIFAWSVSTWLLAIFCCTGCGGGGFCAYKHMRKKQVPRYDQLTGGTAVEPLPA
eukprot:TRINITY_DN14692_c0_g1_i9.p1 TRINITY_DN14692_c0_g1~~TRINITY_DN14692_c0_g1_i9.p1  ORF type:complete len:514 (-),score=73.71 TRINITY_DN14692_c0_g1_i9:311-1852(-)